MKNNKIFIFLNRNINEFNKFLLSFITIIILLLVGMLSYYISTSYSAWNFELVSPNTIALSYNSTRQNQNLDTTNANAPLMTSNMIPVYYNTNDSKWHKADSTNRNSDYQWYDYNAKMWANAVTVTSTNRQTYIDASPGTPIEMADINTMWVWIPRYKYTYFASPTPVSIQITFESGTSSTGTITCSQAVDASETCTDATNGSLVIGTSTYTHPAFTFGDEELEGIWVGKFENSAPTIPTSESSELQNPIIKPDVRSWVYTPISVFFLSTRNMEKYNNPYGFIQNSSATANATYTGEIANDNNNIDPHLMKNIEWGATIYLSHSIYGINGQIYKNDSSSMYTGRSGGMIGTGSQDDSNYYSSTGAYTYDGKNTSTNTYIKDRTLGYKSSTTGTIYGIYDMNGGAWDYVMGNMQNSSNQFNVQNASTWSTSEIPLSKYYDRYKYGINYSDSTRGLLGDGIIETPRWYNGYFSFIYPSAYWVTRGARFSYNSLATGFAIGAETGGSWDVTGSRSTLAVLPNGTN